MLTPTFQTNGTIHGLQLDGAYLTGTNVVTGTLGFKGGGIAAAKNGDVLAPLIMPGQKRTRSVWSAPSLAALWG